MNRNKRLGLFIQFILLVLLIIFLIISLFIKEFTIILQYLSSLMLLIMAYNNNKFYKRKGMTPLYLIIGIIVLVITVIYG